MPAVHRRAFVSASALAVASAASRSTWADELLRFGGAPQELATPLEYFDRLITPTPVFFVRSHFGPPALDRARKLTIEGMVRTPTALDVDELRAFPEVTLTSVLQCAGNGRGLMVPRVPGVQWDNGAMGQATWTGVRLRDVLAKAGLVAGAAHVRLAGADLPPKPTVPAFVRSIPLARALDPGTLLAYRMNGEPLAHAHGAPLRLVVPGWAGDHWVKWLTSLRVQREEADGFYMQTAYRFPVTPGAPGAAIPPDQMRPVSKLPVKSLIATPADGARVPVGPQEVVGVAFSGEAPVSVVELSVDGGASFVRPALEGEPGVGRWQVFRHRFVQQSPARMTAVVRATDARGNTQPEQAIWNPSGYFWNAWHRVSWDVG
jgi:DMSO/TMAO reductase YedYZ molybdopterin-dependent catalytic subunit